MDGLRQEVDPAEVGIDPDRLARLDRHFAGLVDAGRYAGYLLTVARHGRLAHVAAYGRRDIQADRAVDVDTIWQLDSMTKPVTAVGVLLLVEQGLLDLADPVERYLPAFADARVYSDGGTRPAREPIRVWHLLSHTAGMTHASFRAHPVDELYRRAGFGSANPPATDLAGLVDAYARLPLLFDPGSAWNYSVSMLVAGRLIEVVSGQELDEFFATRIFDPLGMTDTGFVVSEDGADRLAAVYAPGEAGLVRVAGRSVRSRPAVLSGGGGLVGSAGDYHRFTSMLCGRGAVDGVRLLAPRTVELMSANHLPGNADLNAFACLPMGVPEHTGVGFGLGVSVTVDPVAHRLAGGAGEYGWAGAASTVFWVDPGADLTVQFMTQLTPITTYPLLRRLKQLVYQSIVD